MHTIAILASGAGSNARRIIDHFRGAEDIRVALVASNKADAGVLEIARENGIPTALITRQNFRESNEFMDILKAHGINFIVLAGFLWQVPAQLIHAYEDRIVNIHPALLPAYGGKGMYGHHVHEAVHAAREAESGITIHLVNEHYDEGRILFQASAPVAETDSPHDIERKVRALEIAHFAPVIGQFLRGQPLAG